MADPPIDDDGGPSLNNEDRTNTDSDKQQGKESGNNSEEPPGQTKQHEWEDLKDEEEAEGNVMSTTPGEEEIVFEEEVLSDDEEIVEIEVHDDDQSSDGGDDDATGDDDFRSNDAVDINSEDLYSIEEDGPVDADNTGKGGAEDGNGASDSDSSNGDESMREERLIADVVEEVASKSDGSNGNSFGNSFSKKDEEDKMFDELAQRRSRNQVAGGRDMQTPASVPTIPLCQIHQKPCRILTANTKLNRGRKFYKCALPQSQECDFFQWADGKPTDSRMILASGSSPRSGGGSSGGGNDDGGAAPIVASRTITTTTTTRTTTRTTRTARKENKGAGIFILTIVFLCLLVAGMVIAIYIYYTAEDDSDDPPTRPPSLNTGGTTPLDHIQNNCNLSGLTQPHVIDQCLCSGEILTVADDVQLRYALHVSNFALSVYQDYNDAKTSCSARNQALLWLSTANDNEFDAQERRQRFALATIFVSLKGEEWINRDRWLSESPSCQWAGVACDTDDIIQSLSIESNLASGTVSSQIVVRTL